MHKKLRFLFPVVVVLVMAFPHSLRAQTLTTIYSFGGASIEGNTALVLSGNTLYGATIGDGFTDFGTVFKIDTGGTTFIPLHTFTHAPPPGYTNSDGALPKGLALSGSTLYGTCSSGANGEGTVFSVDTDGSQFKVLNKFQFNDFDPGGSSPLGGVIVSTNINILYGTTSGEGAHDEGTIYALDITGPTLTTIRPFSARSGPNATNDDGAQPNSELVLSNGILYGTASFGGVYGQGTVFSVNTSGTVYTTLHAFTPRSTFTNDDGATPEGALVLGGGTLYGTAATGGSTGHGTLYAMSTNGLGFHVLHSFTGTADGNQPKGLLLSGNVIYGTTRTGGTFGNGTIFSINTDGSSFTNLHQFTAPASGTNADGAVPEAPLIISGNLLYGTTRNGGDNGRGTIFSLAVGNVSVPPQLAITRSGTNTLLTWSTNSPGYTLQSKTNISSVGGWATVSPAPTIVNGQYTVTNGTSTKINYYRLTQ